MPHFNKIQPSSAVATAKTHGMQTWKIGLHGLLMAGVVCWLATAATVKAEGEDNLYALSYQTQSQQSLRSMQAEPQPELFTGKNREEDNISMLENGYDLMGFSSFESEQVPPEQALAHGRAIKADRILVYVKRGGKSPAAATMEVYKEAIKKGKTLTEKDVAAPPQRYRYYASFWAKLPPPVLGVHLIQLVPKNNLEADEKAEAKVDAEGVRVIAVIHASAAEKAGMLRNDQLISINNDKVYDAASLSKLVQRYRGKTVTLNIRRDGEPMQLAAQL